MVGLLWLMTRRQPRYTPSRASEAADVYRRQSSGAVFSVEKHAHGILYMQNSQNDKNDGKFMTFASGDLNNASTP